MVKIVMILHFCFELKNKKSSKQIFYKSINLLLIENNC
jgi:hypothetical protein